MEVFGLPLADVLLYALGTLVLFQLYTIFHFRRKALKAERNCEWAGKLVARLAEDENWGKITVMSSRNDGPEEYKTWIGEGDPQDLARRAQS